MKLITPEIDLKDILLDVKLPGRYVGGEFGIKEEFSENDFHFGICFPDLYEIGMSNQAVRIIYNGLNKIEGVNCERVYSPAPDFEKILRDKNIPLYTLENGIPLKNLDILGFSIGTELSATNILNVLDLGLIPIFNKDRTDEDPVVIAGGPAITNPVPFGDFFDAVFIGEAEEGLFRIIAEISGMRDKGFTRGEILNKIRSSENFWYKDKKDKVERSVWGNYDKAMEGFYPVANIATVQNNGIIEIMRGCPNSCRFCHAGYFYRPFRQKSLINIIRDADFLLKKTGTAEITLSSLSSGDYNNLDLLINILNDRFAEENVSFSLPSLKVNTFTLPILKELSRVRKSGLTFAVETPAENWLNSINKDVSKDKIIEILLRAKELGWRLAKFYFMIGLPDSERSSEADEIIKFIKEIQTKTGINLNVNVGTFIPKPHTPYQWAAQLSEEEAYTDLRKIKNEFKKNSKVKISYHSPFVSLLEGVITRGDVRVGKLIYDAFSRGARLDAWEDYLSEDIWRSIITGADWDVIGETIRERDFAEELCWSGIDLGVNKKYLKNEMIKSARAETTEKCSVDCVYNCGICSKDFSVKQNSTEIKDLEAGNRDDLAKREKTERDLIFEFTKTGKSIYYSHINTADIFIRAFRKAGYRLKYSQGFNPKPKLEFAHPLSLGIESEVEIAATYIYSENNIDYIKETINKMLPSGIKIIRMIERISDPEKKMKSLMSVYGGSVYRIVPYNRELTRSLTNEIAGYFKDSRPEKVEFNEIELEIRIENDGTKKSNIFYHLDKIMERETFYKNYKLVRKKLLKKGMESFF